MPSSIGQSSASNVDSRPTHTRPQMARKSPTLVHTAPTTNEEAYSLLFQLENALRELLIETLERLDGPQAFRHRLPGDLFTRYKQAIAEERQAVQMGYVPQHPLYYLDFPHLREIITSRPNWDEAFGTIFGRKDVFSANYAQLEFTRNRVAHNRLISPMELQSLRTHVGILATAVGHERYVSLAGRRTQAPSICAHARQLRQLAESTFLACSECSIVEDLSLWTTSETAWWFQDHYLGVDPAPVHAYFTAVRQYTTLPRPRGAGHLLLLWTQQVALPDTFAAAIATLDLIGATWRELP
jgi:hypothetical protein